MQPPGSLFNAAVSVPAATVGKAPANAAVAPGEADSVSSWVNKAMTAQSERERRLAGMAAAIADYEAEFGEPCWRWKRTTRLCGCD